MYMVRIIFIPKVYPLHVHTTSVTKAQQNISNKYECVFYVLVGSVIGCPLRGCLCTTAFDGSEYVKFILKVWICDIS